MLYFLLGISISAILFLYYSLFFKEKRDIALPAISSESESPRKLRMRSCPICGAVMGREDKLYGEIYRAEPRDKVTIKGCKHCFARPAKNSGLKSIN